MTNIETRSGKMRPKSRESTLVLPSHVIRRLDRARGDMSREEFLRLSLGRGTHWTSEKIIRNRDVYLTWEELRRFRQFLIVLWRDWIYLLLRLSVRVRTEEVVEEEVVVEEESPVTVANMEVRPRILSGKVAPVHVTLHNPRDHQEDAEITLTDTTENVVIGTKTISLPARGSKTLKFDWKTEHYKLGDHILDARLTRLITPGS